MKLQKLKIFYNTVVSVRIHKTRCHEDANQKAKSQPGHRVPAAANVAETAGVLIIDIQASDIYCHYCQYNL